MMAARESAIEQLRRQQRRFRTVDEVEAWDEQYSELLERYMFLVLEGPSMVGKTAFARSKCLRDMKVLEINCAAGGEPDLRGYRYGKHGLILCDEIEAPAVAAQRKLFQAGTACVQLGTSPTNIHVYTVFVHRVWIVCCSNNWTASMMQLPEDDRAWLRANSVHVRCEHKMWEQE